MLQLSTIDTAALELLKKLMCFDDFLNMRLAGIEDIAAMKLAAITGRGSRKDFIDLYFLLQKYNLKEMLRFYRNKYFDGSEYLVLKSLTYFADAENDIEVETIKDISWFKIKTYILDIVDKYNQSIL